jgi:hypothetical protein
VYLLLEPVVATSFLRVKHKNIIDSGNSIAYTYGMGRPPNAEKTARKVIALPDVMWDRVSEFRFAERIPTEAAAIRRLIQDGLDAQQSGRRRTAKGKRDV